MADAAAPASCWKQIERARAPKAPPAVRPCTNRHGPSPAMAAAMSTSAADKVAQASAQRSMPSILPRLTAGAIAPRMITMKMRVEELALQADVSVDTIRYYQKQALLPAPSRDGRLAWYSEDHLERIARIKEL